MWRQICQYNVYNFLCFVAFYAVLLQNLSFMWFTLFCREICFVVIYVLWRGENGCQKLCLWRKKDKYEVWMIPRQKCHRLNKCCVWLDFPFDKPHTHSWIGASNPPLGSNYMTVRWKYEKIMQSWKRGDFLRLCRIRISKMLFNKLCRCRSKQNPTWNISRQWRFETVFPLNGGWKCPPICKGQPQPTNFWWVVQ